MKEIIVKIVELTSYGQVIGFESGECEGRAVIWVARRDKSKPYLSESRVALFADDTLARTLPNLLDNWLFRCKEAFAAIA